MREDADFLWFVTQCNLAGLSLIVQYDKRKRRTQARVRWGDVVCEKFASSRQVALSQCVRQLPEGVPPTVLRSLEAWLACSTARASLGRHARCSIDTAFVLADSLKQVGWPSEMQGKICGALDRWLASKEQKPSLAVLRWKAMLPCNLGVHAWVLALDSLLDLFEPQRDELEEALLTALAP